jgi:hypothetical protein
MANQWDNELEQEFNRYIEQANKEYLLYHYYGFHSKEEYEEYLALQKEGHPPSIKEENNSHPEDDEPDWEWLNDIARGR